jgi:hypothetical protein
VEREEAAALSATEGSGALEVDRAPPQPALQRAGAAALERMASDTPTWPPAQLRLIHGELLRLGLQHNPATGVFTESTQRALVEAFGSDEWRALDGAAVLERLRAAVAPSPSSGEHNPLYGHMFKDGVLDVTLGIGFDENNGFAAIVEELKLALAQRQFVEDRGIAGQLYQQAGRALPESAFGLFFVRENALTYKPPAGTARPVHAVVRLVTSQDGERGGETAAAFKEGLDLSDVSYYGGHGRLGSGPDFDRNMRLEIQRKSAVGRALLGSDPSSWKLDGDWVVVDLASEELQARLEAEAQRLGVEPAGLAQRLLDAERVRYLTENGVSVVEMRKDDELLEGLLEDRGDEDGWVEIDEHQVSSWIKEEAARHKTGVGALVRQLIARGDLRITGTNDGNLLLNPKNLHRGEAEAELLYQALASTPSMTGAKGELARGKGDNGYRLWMMVGCRSEDYFQAVRATPGQDAAHTDLIGLGQFGVGSDLALFPTLLDGLLQQMSAEQILRTLEAQASHLDPRQQTIVGSGFADNPTKR